MDNKHLLGIYAIVNQVTSCPKDMIHIFVTSGDLVSTFSEFCVSQTPQICGCGLKRPKNKNRKKNKKIESRQKNKIFSR